MRAWAFSILIGLMIPAVQAWEPAPPPTPVKPDIVFPVFPSVPDSPPPPQPNPLLVPTLGTGQFYVITANKPYLILASGDGEVVISTRKPPFQLPTDQAIGWTAPATDPDFVTFSDPYIYLVKAKKNGKEGTVNLEIIPSLNATGTDGKQIPLMKADIIKKSILVKTGVGPQPPPVNPPDPTVPVGPVTSFHVIFVVESGSTLPLKQIGARDAKIVRDYITTNTTADGKTAGWRAYDPQENTTNETPTFKALWATVQPKLTTVPCIVIEVNGKATIEPWPTDAASSLALLKKYHGDK